MSTIEKLSCLNPQSATLRASKRVPLARAQTDVAAPESRFFNLWPMSAAIGGRRVYLHRKETSAYIANIYASSADDRLLSAGPSVRFRNSGFFLFA